MFFREELVNIFVFPLIYSHRSASGMRFIKPCQFAAASQSYRFCWWSGLVPPQHRKKKSFRILKSLPALGTQSTSGDWQQPWDPGSCSRSPGCQGSDQGGGCRSHHIPPWVVGQTRSGPRAKNAPWAVRAFTAAEASPLPSRLENDGSQPEQGGLAAPSGPQVRKWCSQHAPSPPTP